MRWSAVVLALCAACAHRPPPTDASRVHLDDVDAAPEAPADRRNWISPRAYRHYVDALLARERDDHETAVSELREAVLFDPDSAHLRTLLAEELARVGRLDDAEEAVRAALQRDPSHAAAHLLAARIALVRDKPAVARAELQAAAAAAPDDGEAARELVRLEIVEGNVPAARQAAAKLDAAAQRGDAEDPSGSRLRAQAAAAWVDVARVYAQKHEDAAADEAFARARALDPGDPDVLLAHVAYLDSRRRFAEEREATQRLLARAPDSPDLLSSLVRLSLQEGDFEAASAHLRKLVALVSDVEPQDEEPRRELAAALFRSGLSLLETRRTEEAQGAFSAALRLYPNHPQIALYRALAVDQRGRHREAAEQFERIERTAATREAALDLERGPSFLSGNAASVGLEAKVQAALARGRAGESQESARRLRALFAEQPADESVAIGLLETLDRAGRAAEAAQLLGEASRAHPESEPLLFAWASAQDRAGRRAAALETMRELLRKSPHHPGALNYVGYSLAEKGERLEEAVKLLAEAVDQRPDDGAIADSYGYCLLRLGRVDAALTELRRADHLAPGDPVIIAHLGDALLAAGRRAEAQSAFRRALGRLAPRRGTRSASLASGELPERSPEPGDDAVRADLLRKLRALTPR